jgi:MFS family permease
MPEITADLAGDAGPGVGPAGIPGDSPAGWPDRGRLWRTLRTPGVRHLLGAEAFSDLGDGLSYVALAWLTLQLTGSGLALGGVLAAQGVPRAVFTLIGGATSDRFSPRLQMVASAAARAAVTAAIGGLALAHAASLWNLYALAVVFGLVDAFFQPARGSLLPRVVDPGQLEPSNALLSSAARTCSIAGPALGGVLVATAGAGFAFLGDAACFLLVVAALARLRPAKDAARANGDDPAAGGTGPSLAARIGAGLRYTLADPRLRAVLAIDAAITFSYAGPLTVGLASLVRYRFGQSAAAFGSLDAALALGGLAGALTGGTVRVRPRIGLLIAALAGWMACGMIVLGLVPDLWLGLATGFAMGAGVGFQGVFGLSWVQRAIDPQVLGRVLSVDMVAGYALAPVSLVLTGALARGHLEVLYLGTAGLLFLTAAGILASRTVRLMT